MSGTEMPPTLLPTAHGAGGAGRVGRNLVMALAELGIGVANQCRQAMGAGEALAKAVEFVGAGLVSVAADLADSSGLSG